MTRDDRRRNRLTAIVAEREPLVRIRVAQTLRDLDLMTFEVDTGHEAVELVASVPVHTLVINVDLPELGGLETIRTIRTMGRVPPFVLMAAEITHDLRMTAMDCNAVTIIQTPVDLALVPDIVRTILMRSYGRR